MPSASSQSSMQITAQMENNDATKSVLNLLEKKVRNLEKRKSKLDSYKKLVDDGKTLNEDQKLAVGQLDQVEQNLEFARDLQKQINQVYFEHQKLQKKMAKRDQAAMLVAQHNSDISKVCQVLELQALMDNLSEDVRVDFLNGTNGAVAVTKENFVQIDNFYKLITPNPDGEQPMKEQQLSASQHIVNLLEASSEPVVETTYKALNELVSSIKKCGYFDQPQTDEEEEADEEEEPANTDDQVLAGDGDAAPEEAEKAQEATNGSPESQFNGSDTASSADSSVNQNSLNQGENMAAFADNELGLNFMSESEVESKPPSVAPSDSQTSNPPCDEREFVASASDDAWVEQGEGGHPVEEGDDAGYDTVQHSNGFSRGGRGGRGGFRGRDGGFGRRGGGPPGERGNRRGRGGFSGPPRGGGSRGGFGQQDNYQRRGGGGAGRGPRGGAPPRGGQRGGRRGGGFPQQ